MDLNQHFFNLLLDELCDKGLAVNDQVIPEGLWHLWLKEAQSLENEFKSARIGQGQNPIQAKTIRSDATLWLEPHHHAWPSLHKIRAGVARTCSLSLRSIEAHYARYAPGSFYDEHIDQPPVVNSPQSQGPRLITFIVYLNSDWQKSDGGELEIDQKLIQPYGGRLVLFRSNVFKHRVRKTHRERFSLTGWFRDDERLFDR